MADSLSDSERLQLAENANRIYRQQLNYMQGHLTSLRSLIQDKESIIEDLMLRYETGAIKQDPYHELRTKAIQHFCDTFTSHVVFGYLREIKAVRQHIPAEIQALCLSFYGSLEISNQPDLPGKCKELASQILVENFDLRSEVQELKSKLDCLNDELNQKSIIESLEDARASLTMDGVQMID